jgi:hypothetical protein
MKLFKKETLRIKKGNQKNILLFIGTLVFLLVICEFDLGKELVVKLGNETLYLPIPVLFPILFVFSYANILYLRFCFSEGWTLLQKLVLGLLNSGFVLLIFKGGFELWKTTQGDIDAVFFAANKVAFQLTFRSVAFWVMYQTLLMVYGLSVLKIIVSPRKK